MPGKAISPNCQNVKFYFLIEADYLDMFSGFAGMLSPTVYFAGLRDGEWGRYLYTAGAA